MQPLSVFFANLVRSGQSVDQFVQARDLAAGSGLVDDSFGSRFVNVGNGTVQSGLGCLFFTVGNGRTDLLNEGAHGGANMSVAGSTDSSLFISFDCGFVISQCGCPPV